MVVAMMPLWGRAHPEVSIRIRSVWSVMPGSDARPWRQGSCCQAGAGACSFAFRRTDIPCDAPDLVELKVGV